MAKKPKVKISFSVSIPCRVEAWVEDRGDDYLTIASVHDVVPGMSSPSGITEHMTDEDRDAMLAAYRKAAGK